jgi:3-dehydroquinate dehydratase-1
MAELQLGTIGLGKVPRVVVIIDRVIPVDTLAGLKEKGADILEIRVDLFPCGFDEVLSYLESLRSSAAFPMIGTIREAGDNRKNRLSMFKKIEPFVDAVDIEVDARIGRDVAALFTDKTVIVSEHDFEKTPDHDALMGIVDRAVKVGADIIKIAAMPQNREDVTSLLSFTKERTEPLVTIAMGETGKISRVTAPLFGSLYTYAFIHDSVAPGQFSLDDLVRELQTFYPEMRS